MKPIGIILGLGIGLLVGLLYGIDKKKPQWWQILAISLLCLACLVNLVPPLSTNLQVAKNVIKMKSDILIPIKLTPTAAIQDYHSFSAFEVKYNNITDTLLTSKEIAANLSLNTTYIVESKYDTTLNKFYSDKIVSTSPSISYPFIPTLKDRIRIMNFHVPVAWVCVISFLLSMIYSIKYLKKRDLYYDLVASSAASIGLLYTILATVTGMLWAKFNWGAYWNWDPRETSIFFLLLIYFAYFGLRTAIENDEQKARLSSVYSILAFVTVPFFIFVLPRITTGLHPGSKDESNSGPVLSASQNMLDSQLLIGFAISLAAFIIIYFWIFNLRVRTAKAEHKYELLKFNK
ncbi:MAG: cytochrome c biogenesis protein [Candidatus Kapabacteria bacterium]|nr:cytochrome c biogenesis protein [Candidatus Kapabacteria bacterium]